MVLTYSPAVKLVHLAVWAPGAARGGGEWGKRGVLKQAWSACQPSQAASAPQTKAGHDLAPSVLMQLQKYTCKHTCTQQTGWHG